MIKTAEISFRIGFSEGLSPYADFTEIKRKWKFKQGKENWNIEKAFRQGWHMARDEAKILFFNPTLEV